MRPSLRWEILVLAVFTPATLGLATLLTVNRNVTVHVNSSSIHESLEHSVAVFESMLRTRSRELAGGGQVIAQDPRFFSLLMLGTTQRDSRFVATVKGMASDFNRITHADLFEVMDRRGRMLASVGSAASSVSSRRELLAAAQRGRPVEAILVEADAHYQVALTPVFADHRIVGVLLLGSQIGPSLANELRSQMRCEVTFLSGRVITGTTLRAPGDRAALVHALGALNLGPGKDLGKLGVQQVHGPHDIYLTLVRRIPVSDPATPQLYVMQRSYDPESSFLHRMQFDMLMLALLALVAALATGLLFSEQILRPIQSLVRGAQEMEKGNYDYPLKITRRDEIGYLADRFSVMRQRERTYLAGLEQSAQLKSDFLSLASHELRTPISVLIGYRDVLAAGDLGPLNPEQSKVLEVMRVHLTRLTQMADDASRFAQIKSERLTLEFVPCEVEPIVQRAVAAARFAGAARTVDVETRCDAMSGPADADSQSLEQAITHIVTNAIRFTPDGGRIVVYAHESSGSLLIEVKDSGVGIAEDKMNAVLSHGEPVAEINNHQSPTGLEFNTTGLGLGLSIARGIVEAHGGTIRASSTPGEGSTFVIEMPMKRGGEMRSAA